MSEVWACSLPAIDAVALAEMRDWKGAEICNEPGRVWLRGTDEDAALWALCKKLPKAGCYTVLDTGQLCALGAQVPRGRLPSGPWRLLSAWAQEMSAGASGEMPLAAALHLVRSREPDEPTVLWTGLVGFQFYARTASILKLQAWSIAVLDATNILVRGRPQPPLSGVRLVDRDGIMVPSGWDWAPDVPAAAVRATYGLQPGETALWMNDGTWHRLPADIWQPANRDTIAMLTAMVARG